MRCTCLLLTQSGHSGEAAGQFHDLAHAGGVESSMRRTSPMMGSTAAGSQPRRQTVSHLHEMLGLADRRRAPLAARAIAARLEHPPVVELDPEQHVHVLEAAGDCGVEADLELAEEILHVGLARRASVKVRIPTLPSSKALATVYCSENLPSRPVLGRGRLT